MQNKLFLTILIIGLSLNAHAGKYAAEFLTTGVGARALGMGGAFVAVADDASATFWNPAGMTQLSGPEMMLMHATRFSGLLQTDMVNVVYPGKKYVVGVNYIRMGIDNIPYSSRLDLNGRPIIDKYVSDYEEAAFLSMGARLSDHIAIGANLKTLRQAVGENSSLGFGFDLGLLYRWNDQWAFGANLQDITGTYIYWDTGHRDTKAPGAQLGVSYRKSIPFLRSSVLLSVQHNIRFEGQAVAGHVNFGDIANGDFHSGLEFTILERLAFRLGSYANDLSIGAGLAVKMLKFDYAFMSHDLGNAHRISASFKF